MVLAAELLDGAACQPGAFFFGASVPFFGVLGALIQAQAEASNRGLCHRPSAYAARGARPYALYAGGSRQSCVLWQVNGLSSARGRESCS